MKVYRVRSLADIYVMTATMVAVTIVYVALGIGPMLRGELSGTGFWGQVAVYLGLGAVSAYSAVASLRAVCEIRVADDGRIEFERGVGVTRVAATDITSLEGRYVHRKRALTMAKRRVWSIKLRSTAGVFDMVDFPELMDFVARVKTHNPALEFRGTWPRGIP